MNRSTYLTPEGYQNLKAELQDLIDNKRPDIARRLRLAIDMGDLSENADYIAAKEEQGFLEGRIKEIESMLLSAVIINESQSDLVNLGSTVTIQEVDSEPETYKIVGAQEANPLKGSISNESPIGKALLGRRTGDNVKVHTPGGDIVFKITQIK
jgi:transcription elongation factor GreA